jgi:superfamily II DNA or RNA helicase
MSNLESDINYCNVNLENEYKLTKSSPIEYNKFILNKELLESKCLQQQDNENKNINDFLYPNLNDVNFNIKIAEKKEFNDTKYDGTIHNNIKEYADLLAKADFELSPHQMFVKNFLSSQTPYNSLLLYHGLGTGKTLSAIGVCEEMRDYMRQMGITKRIIIVASENVQDNFKLQIFDERKLQLVDGVWTIKGASSIGNKLLKEINPMNMKGISKERIVNQIKNLINTYYIFLGYGQFANYIIKTIHYDEQLKIEESNIKKTKKIEELGDAKITLNKKIIKKLRNEFDNRLIVIDEVHNIRKTEDNENKKVALNLELLVKAAKNMRLLLLSATPMYNSYKEIIWLLNLMNINDGRGIIQSKDVFDKNGNFKEKGEELLIRKATGYVSFVRGENPYTFPYRVYPNEFAKKNTFPFIEYPSYQMNLKKIKSEDKKRILGIYLNTIGNCGKCGMCQYCIYRYIIYFLRKKQFSITTKKGVTREMPNFENMESFGYTLLQTPLESLIISYPMKGIKEIMEILPDEKYSEVLDQENINEAINKEEEFDINSKEIAISTRNSVKEENEDTPKNQEESINMQKIGGNEENRKELEEYSINMSLDPHYLTGKKGLERMMNYIDQKSPPLKGDFEYKKTTLNDYGKIFSYDKIGKYSSKIKSVLDKILIKNTNIDVDVKVSEGVILIYSQYIDSGLIPMALALEEFGFTRYGENVKPLFKNKPSEVVDVRTMKPPTDKKNFMPARYSMITGDPRLSPNNDFEVKGLTNDDNKEGNKIKVILISKAGSEGIDFKFIRQVHILEPWYNMNRIEQIIGRAVRNFSHKDLPFEKRNVQIFMYGTILGDNKEEAADLYVYRLAELKAVQTGNITRLLKETSVDCIINHEQTNFTQETMTKYLNDEITQELSTGLVIHDFKIGDAPFSPACDYMPTCNYVCRPTKDINEDSLNEDTYNDTFIKMNSDKIIQKIRLLMREAFFYKKDVLIELINLPKKYPLVQIYSALTTLIDDNNEFIVDKYGRNGRLVNIGDYYLFQPIELLDKNISIYERSVPIDYKHNMINFEIKKEVVKDRSKKLNVQLPSINMEDEDNKAKEKILIELNENFNITKEYLKPNTRVPRGDDNWYKHCGVAMKKLAKSFPDMRDHLLHFLVAHMIELLLFEEKVDLLNYIYSMKEINNNSVEYLIKQYFERKSIVTRNNIAIILYNLNKLKIMIYNNDSSKWVEARPEDQKEIEDSKAVMELMDFKKSDYNNIVGFMGYEKNNKYLIFKTKDMLSSRDTGARCDEAGKNKTIQLLNQIIGEEKYTKENTKILKDEDKNVIQEAVGHVELCVTQEFILRYFDKIRKNNKKWFLTPEMALYYKLYTIHVK